MGEKRFVLVFDEVMKKKLEKAILKTNYKEIIKQWFDKLEEQGPNAGKLLDIEVQLVFMGSRVGLLIVNQPF